KQATSRQARGSYVPLIPQKSLPEIISGRLFCVQTTECRVDLRSWFEFIKLVLFAPVFTLQILI
ncbi:MAG: hypothetical protein RSA67_05515, partial [Alistipes sp.]